MKLLLTRKFFIVMLLRVFLGAHYPRNLLSYAYLEVGIIEAISE